MENNLQIPKGLDPEAVDLARSIRRKESGTNYGAVGDGGKSLGGYQWNNGNEPLAPGQIPANFRTQAQEAGLNPDDFSPYNQDMVAYHAIKRDKDAGLNVVQIAAKWNGGDPNRYDPNYVTPSGLPSQKPGVYDVPAYARDVNNYYQQLKQQRQTLQTSEQFQQAGQQLAGTSAEQPKQSFISKLGYGIAKPFVKLGLGATKLLSPNRELSPEGQILKEQFEKRGNDVTINSLKEGLGTGLEAATTFIGGEGAANTLIGSGAKNLLKIAGQGALSGAKAGAVQGLGASLQTQDKLGGNLVETGKGALLGGAVGGVLSPAIAAIPRLGKLSQAVTNPIEREKLAKDMIAQEWDRVRMAVPLGIRQNQEELLKNTGHNAFSDLVEFGVIPSQKGGAYDIEGASELLNTHLTNANNVLNKVKQNETGIFNVDEAFNRTLDKIDNLKIDASRKEAMAQKLKSILDSNITEPADILENGQRLLNADEAVKIKQILRNEAGFETSAMTDVKSKKILQSPYNTFAQELDSEIDNNATIPQFKEANHIVTRLLNAQSVLNKLSGKPVRVAGGLTGKLSRKFLTTGGGFSVGNIPGAIIGNLTGDILEDFYTNPEVRTALWRKILQNTDKQAPINAIAQGVEESIQKKATTPVKLGGSVDTLQKYKTGMGKKLQDMTSEELADFVKKNPNKLDEVQRLLFK